jgi:hypothetical protein
MDRTMANPMVLKSAIVSNIFLFSLSSAMAKAYPLSLEIVSNHITESRFIMQGSFWPRYSRCKMASDEGSNALEQMAFFSCSVKTYQVKITSLST